MQIIPKLDYRTKLNQLPQFITKVDNRLLRGSAVINPITLYRMKKNGVNQIIDLRNSAFIQSLMEQGICKLLKINYKNHKYSHRLSRIPESDFFEKINSEIISNNGITYIHCQYGKRRTGISVGVYEKKHTNKTKDEILNNLINLGFQELKTAIDSPKTRKLRTIFNDFIHKYY